MMQEQKRRGNFVRTAIQELKTVLICFSMLGYIYIYGLEKWYAEPTSFINTTVGTICIFNQAECPLVLQLQHHHPSNTECLRSSTSSRYEPTEL